MLYLYSLMLIMTSFFIMQRSIVFVQMNNYHFLLKGGLLREFAINNIVALLLISVNIIMESLSINKIIEYAVSLILLTTFSIIMISRHYKVKPNYTNRLKRLNLVFLANIILINTILLLNLAYFRVNCYEIVYSSIAIFFNYLILYASLMIMKPYENKLNNSYIINAKNKLSTMKNIQVIGITGSYGKTTVKNILNTLLGEKYNVKSTPASFNTPLGIAMSIGELKGDEDYFIVEMGARRQGDIQMLCDIVDPKFGIITGVSKQHMESFKDIKIVENTKYELYNNIPNDGVCVFNGFDDITFKMYNYSKICNSVITNNIYYNISNIKTSQLGSTFDLIINGETKQCHTILLGKHNVENILLASALAYNLGISMDEISEGISKIKPISHRLEVQNINGITIIDDSYNANIKGVERALEALSLFDRRRIVASQGIVECGKDEAIINTNLGHSIAKVANVVVLIGRERKHIFKGLADSNFNMQNVIMAKNMKEAEHIFSQLIKRGDVVLITNDLPDNY